MNNIIIEKWERKRGARCSEHIARGTFLWGTLYSTGASGAAYLLSRRISGETPSFTEIFLESLLVFLPCGAAGGYIKWRTANMKPATRKRIVKRGRINSIHRLVAYRRLIRMRPGHA